MLSDIAQNDIPFRSAYAQSLLNEVSKELVKQVKDAVKNKEKPFKHIFKGNDSIVLPYESITEDEKIPLEIMNSTACSNDLNILL